MADGQREGEIRRAARAGCAEGLRCYLPPAVGIVVIGLALMLLAVLAHFVLGINTVAEVAGAVALGGGTLGIRPLREIFRRARVRADGTDPVATGTAVQGRTGAPR